MAGLKIFDTDECAFADVRVDIAAARILKLKGIKWGSKVDKSYRRGEGNKPRGIQHGDREYMGEIKVSRGVLTDMNIFAQSLGYDDILEFSFPVVISYRKKGSRKQELVTLADCEITDYIDELNSGDKEGIVTLPIMFLGFKQVLN